MTVPCERARLDMLLENAESTLQKTVGAFRAACEPVNLARLLMGDRITAWYSNGYGLTGGAVWNVDCSHMPRIVIVLSINRSNGGECLDRLAFSGSDMS